MERCRGGVVCCCGCERTRFFRLPFLFGFLLRCVVRLYARCLPCNNGELAAPSLFSRQAKERANKKKLLDLNENSKTANQHLRLRVPNTAGGSPSGMERQHKWNGAAAQIEGAELLNYIHLAPIKRSSCFSSYLPFRRDGRHAWIDEANRTAWLRFQLEPPVSPVRSSIDRTTVK